MAATTKDARPAVLSATAPRTIAPGDRAADKAFARIGWKEAPALGVLGKSGTGKTELARRLIPIYLAKSGGIAIVIDDKELQPRYEGQYYRDPDELESNVRPLQPEPHVIVYRGVPAQMVGVDHERVAIYQQRLAGLGFETLCVHDEMSDAARYGQWRAGSDSLLARQFVKGRKVKVGKLWLTQLPAFVPEEPWTQSTMIFCFNVDETTLNRLRKHKWVDDRLARTIAALPDGNVEPSKRGYFVLLEPECRSDGQIYRF